MPYAKLRCILLSITPEKQIAHFVTLTLSSHVPYSLLLPLVWRIKECGMQHVFHLHLNGEVVEVLAPVHKTLLEVLREDLRLTGTKHGCELGECGTCAVLVDGEPVLSCLYLGLEGEGRRVDTVEGMAGPTGLHPLQKAFADLGAAQCGYCTPGFLLTAKELLERNPKPSRDEIAQAL